MRLRFGVIAGVSCLDDVIEEVLEDGVRFLVAGDAADGVDVRVAGVVDASLDGLVECVAFRCLLLGARLVHLKSVTNEKKTSPR